MKRPRNRGGGTRAVVTLTVALAFVLIVSGTSCAQSRGGSRWRSSRYGRQGAEIWLEAPRVGVATGSGYRNGTELPGDQTDDLDLSPGLGFGFGIMFAFSDKVALEGRIVQTSHDVSDSDRSWDLDQVFAGGRYIFLYDRRIQIFVDAREGSEEDMERFGELQGELSRTAREANQAFSQVDPDLRRRGGARHTLEFDSTESLLTDFERLSGFGWYLATGVDYVASSRWVVSLRTDYTVMKYNHILVGTTEEDIEDPFDGSSFGVSLSINYRVPIWW